MHKEHMELALKKINTTVLNLQLLFKVLWTQYRTKQVNGTIWNGVWTVSNENLNIQRDRTKQNGLKIKSANYKNENFPKSHAHLGHITSKIWC